MPFPKQTPSTFDRAGVESLKPNQIGCYGLCRDTIWIYIGRGDIRDRLLDHFNDDNPCITREGPTHFVTVVTSDDEATERRLITGFDPICNQRVG